MAIAPFPGIRATGLDTDAIGQTVPNVLKMFAAGRNFAQEDHQNALRFAVGGRMAEGDITGATQAAFRGGDVKMGKDISNWSSDRQMRAVAAIREGAERADTPAKWAQVVRSVESAFGPETVADYRDFNSRPKAMTVLQEAELKLRQKADDRARAAESRSRALHEQDLKLRTAQATEATMTPEQKAVRLEKLGESYGLRGADLRNFVLRGGQYTPPSLTERMLQGMPGAQPQPGAAPPLQSPVRPQSFEGSTDPNLIPTQVAAPQPAAPAEPTISTPFGPMTEEQARRFSFALAAEGKGEAGKMMLEETNRLALGKEATNKLDEKIANSVEQLARVQGIAETFDERFLAIGTRLNMTGAGWMAKIDPKRVTPEVRADLTKFATFRRRSQENINRLINELSGAATSVQEAERIQAQVPTVGTGIFDGDDPVSFKAKMDDVMSQTKLAMARYAFLKKNNPQIIGQLAKARFAGVENILPLDRMRDIINERKNQIFQELRNQMPQAPREQLIPIVVEQMKQEFGV